MILSFESLKVIITPLASFFRCRRLSFREIRILTVNPRCRIFEIRHHWFTNMWLACGPLSDGGKNSKLFNVNFDILKFCFETNRFRRLCAIYFDQSVQTKLQLWSKLGKPRTLECFESRNRRLSYKLFGHSASKQYIFWSRSSSKY